MYPSKVLDQVPSSVRKPVASSRDPQGSMGRSQNSGLLAGIEARAAVVKSRFVRLPNEPEDARMTGVTRSLDRRLLALNIRGTRFSGLVLEQAKIA